MPGNVPLLIVGGTGAAVAFLVGTADAEEKYFLAEDPTNVH